MPPIQAEDLHNALDDVFQEVDKTVLLKDLTKDEVKEASYVNNLASPSIESDHFNQLFHQLEFYMERAPEMDCIFIRRRIAEIKSGMRSINHQFEGLFLTGSRLENFLIHRRTSKIHFAH